MAKTIARPVIDIPDFSKYVIENTEPKQQHGDPIKKHAESIKLAPFILQAEGGLSDSPYDSASAFPCPTEFNGRNYHTNKGITYATWNHVFGWDNDMRFLKMNTDDWNTIFKKYYWDKYQADNIYSQSVANVLVDWVWASGVWGIRFVQRMVGVTEDGIAGKNTLTAINKQNKDVFLKRLYDRREAHFRSLAKNDPIHGAPNLKGWLNRLENLKKYNAQFDL